MPPDTPSKTRRPVKLIVPLPKVVSIVASNINSETQAESKTWTTSFGVCTRIEYREESHPNATTQWQTDMNRSKWKRNENCKNWQSESVKWICEINAYKNLSATLSSILRCRS